MIGAVLVRLRELISLLPNLVHAVLKLETPSCPYPRQPLAVLQVQRVPSLIFQNGSAICLAIPRRGYRPLRSARCRPSHAATTRSFVSGSIPELFVHTRPPARSRASTTTHR